MGWMALVTGFAFFIWVDWAGIVFLLFFGLKELQLEVFLKSLTTTYAGLYFILLGNFAGAVMATIVFSVTAISFPLLVDRDIDFATAMTASVRAIITVFIALPVILPVLGHGTWHMYRKVVADAVQPEAKRL